MTASRRTRHPNSAARWGRPRLRTTAPPTGSACAIWLPAPPNSETAPETAKGDPMIDPISTPAETSGAAGPRDADIKFDIDGDRLREECGVFGVFGHPDAAAITALGLHALQHRGQEAAGIVSFDGKRFHSERRMGLVADAFARREVIDRLPGTSAIGHVRYSTTGETVLRNVQPLFAELEGGGFAIGHNA